MPRLDTSKRIADALKSVQAAKSRGDWESCIRISRDALSLQPTPGGDLWLNLKGALALCLIEAQDNDLTSPLNESVEIYKEVRDCYSIEERPVPWAKANVGLGYAHFLLAATGNTEALEQALHYHKEALKVFRKEKYPKEWATIVSGLGMVYGRRAKGGIPENLRRARRCYEATLNVYTEEDYPENHADAVANVKYFRDKLAYLERELARLRAGQ